MAAGHDPNVARALNCRTALFRLILSGSGENYSMTQTRSNDDVAIVFQSIAELLEAQGENPFKIRAYRNAVRTLEELPEPIASIDARGELRKVPGFGEAIAGKTQEILATGTCELYERLKAEAPARVPAPGISPSQGTLAAEADSDEEIAPPW